MLKSPTLTTDSNHNVGMHVTLSVITLAEPFLSNSLKRWHKWTFNVFRSAATLIKTTQCVGLCVAELDTLWFIMSPVTAGQGCCVTMETVESSF